MIYLDVAATTKPKQEVVDAMIPYYTDKWYNPSSLYSSAVKIKKDIENARQTIGDSINANGSEIFFTSGGSEANCWAIRGFIDNCRINCRNPVIITSIIEHKSILNCLDHMDADVYHIEVDKNGYINLKLLEEILHHLSVENSIDNILVSIQFANNEIGTIQKIKEIARISHKYNAIFHTDAVQAFGKLHIDVEKIGIDMLSASGHKIGAPKGIGFLYKKSSIEIQPLIYGSQMDSMRGGTENVANIIGMAKAVETMDYNWNMKSIRNYMIDMLQDNFNCKINGSIVDRLSNNISVTFHQNITAEALIYILDMSGIFIASGSACNSHSSMPSHVLKAIGLTDEEAARTIRITLPDDIGYDEFDYALIDEVIYELDKSIKFLLME